MRSQFKHVLSRNQHFQHAVTGKDPVDVLIRLAEEAVAEYRKFIDVVESVERDENYFIDEGE
jgi:hypothetical protein